VFRRALPPLAVLLAGFASDAFAQGAAVSTTIAPSIRFEGMGRASAAAWWGDDPDYWANPALLGYHRGLRYETGETQLVPELADDVWFRTKRFTLAGYGVGFAFAGRPFDEVGEVHLSYGTSEGTDESGNPLGTFESYEDIRSWGFGVSVASALESIWRLRGLDAPAVTRWADVAFGMNFKDIDVVLSPDFDGSGVGRGSTTAEDLGVFARVTPIDTFRPREDGSDAPSWLVRADAGFGWSVVNDGPPTITFGVADIEDPLTEETRTSFSARVALHPAAIDQSLEGANLGWLARSLSPLVSVGGAMQAHTQRAYSESDIDELGLEVTLGNVFWIRTGHIDDPDGGIDASTSGWGAGFNYAGVAGFRYDRSGMPQAFGEEPDRSAWSFYVDPIRAIAEF